MRRWVLPDDISCADVVDFLRSLPDGSVDLLATDPPYGSPATSLPASAGGLVETPSATIDTAKWDAPQRTRRLRRGSAEYKEGMTGEKRYAERRGSLVNYPVATIAFIRFRKWVTLWAREALRVLRPGGYMVASALPRTFDALSWGVRMAGFEIRDSLATPGVALWLQSQGWPKATDVLSEISGWAGCAGALKGSYELSVCARKPLLGTVPANVLAHGTGAIDVDAGRLGTRGYWPPNVVLAHGTACRPGVCAPWCVVGLVDAQGPNGKSLADFFLLPGEDLESGDREALVVGHHALKVSPSDRTLPGYRRIVPASPVAPDHGVSEERAAALCRGLGIPCGVGESWLETLKDWPIPEMLVEVLDEFDSTEWVQAANGHPAVKPLSWASWIVRVFSPRPERVGRSVVVVDPFAGSGTFALAALAEGRRPVINDIAPKCVATADARLEVFRKGRPLAPRLLVSPRGEALWGVSAVKEEKKVVEAVEAPTVPVATPKVGTTRRIFSSAMSGVPVGLRKCPRCGSTKDIETDFGYRMMAGRQKVQSYCRLCRSLKAPVVSP